MTALSLKAAENVIASTGNANGMRFNDTIYAAVSKGQSFTIMDSVNYYLQHNYLQWLVKCPTWSQPARAHGAETLARRSPRVRVGRQVIRHGFSIARCP